MKKVVLAALLTCVALAPGLPLVSFAQDAQAAPAAAAGQVQMPDAEYQVYNNANTQTDPKAQAAGLEAYLTQFPNSGVKLNVLLTLTQTYFKVGDLAKAVDAANRALQLDPANLQALTYATALETTIAGSATDPAAKQAALDAAAGYAQKGLAVAKPAAMSDADFKTLQNTAYPIFYSALGADSLGKKDTAGAIDAFKKELGSVPVAQTQDPKQQQLPDTYQLALAYWQSTPPDFLSCAFYAARFVDYAPDPFKGQVAPTAKYCYKEYHGKDDGYDQAGATGAGEPIPAGQPGHDDYPSADHGRDHRRRSEGYASRPVGDQRQGEHPAERHAGPGGRGVELDEGQVVPVPGPAGDRVDAAAGAGGCLRRCEGQ